MTQKKSNPISQFLVIMGLIVVFLTVWIVLSAKDFTELYWLLLAIGVSLGITELAVAWLLHIHIKQ